MNKKSNIKPFELIVHIAGWLVLFGIPLLFVEKMGNSYFINWGMYRHHLMVVSFFLGAFYVNYLYLIPKFLFQKKRIVFFTLNVLLLLLVGVSFEWLSSFDMPPPEGMNPEHFEHQTFIPRYVMFYLRDLALTCLTICFSIALKMVLRFNELEKSRAESEQSRVAAELSNLRNQLNPHFLLNTLNNIYALIAFDKDKAQQAVHDLSRLLRYVLYDNQAMFVPLVHEVDFLENYIQLMRIRLDARVEVDVCFSVAKTSSIEIAPMIFISLVENAFKHGIAPDEPSVISIFLGENDHGQVICNIRNSFHPKNESDRSGSGIGLEQVRKRLDLLYPNAYVWTTDLLVDSKMFSSVLTINTKL